MSDKAMDSARAYERHDYVPRGVVYNRMADVQSPPGTSEWPFPAAGRFDDWSPRHCRDSSAMEKTYGRICLAASGGSLIAVGILIGIRGWMG